MSPDVEAILDRWEASRESGQEISPEQLCTGRPELLEEVRWYIRALGSVESHFGHSGAASRQKQYCDDGELASSRRTQSEYGPGSEVEAGTRYQILRFHASGGLGVVYEALDTELQRRVAIKVPRYSRLSEAARHRFEREAKITGQLDHPGVIPVYAIKSEKSLQPLYVMRFVEGVTFHQAVERLYQPSQMAGRHKHRARFDSMDFRDLIQKLATVCHIIAFAHQKRVIHRDIKPSNILIGKFGEVLMLDWGLARKLDGSTGFSDKESNQASEVRFGSSLVSATGVKSDVLSSPTLAGDVLGTPAFASPEQLLGQTALVDERTDIYSLGATLLYLATGRLTTSVSGIDSYLVRLQCGKGVSAFEFDSTVPRGLEAICRKAMSLNPTDRYASVGEMTLDLERWLADEPVSVTKDPLTVQLARLASRHPGRFAASAATILAALICGLLIAYLLNWKNRELRFANRDLELAVQDSRSANEAALKALRSLFDDVIARKFSESEALTDVERRFLEGIERQYETYASLKGTTLETLLIRAEGNLRAGQILRTLSQSEPAKKRFEIARQLYGELFTEMKRFEIASGYADTLSQVALVQREFGELNSARITGELGIRVIEELRDPQSGAQELSTTQHQAIATIEARLCQELAFLNESGDQFEKSIVWNERAASLLMELTQTSNGIQHQRSLARTCRSLGECCRLLNRREDMVKYSQQAVDVSRKALAADSDSQLGLTGLAWSLYDASYVAEAEAKPNEAETLVAEGIELIRPYRIKHPLLTDYRALEASLLHRRAAILQGQTGREHDAIKDLQDCLRLLEGEMTASGSFQSAQLALRVFRKLHLLQVSTAQNAAAQTTATTAAKQSAIFLSRYPEIIDNPELNQIIRQFSGSADQD